MSDNKLEQELSQRAPETPSEQVPSPQQGEPTPPGQAEIHADLTLAKGQRWTTNDAMCTGARSVEVSAEAAGARTARERTIALTVAAAVAYAAAVTSGGGETI